MGASHVRAMVSEGAKVVFGDILDHEGELWPKKSAIPADTFALDVTQARSNGRSAVATAINEFGGIPCAGQQCGDHQRRHAGGLRGLRVAADPRRQPDRSFPGHPRSRSNR